MDLCQNQTGIPCDRSRRHCRRCACGINPARLNWLRNWDGKAGRPGLPHQVARIKSDAWWALRPWARWSPAARSRGSSAGGRSEAGRLDGRSPSTTPACPPAKPHRPTRPAMTFNPAVRRAASQESRVAAPAEIGGLGVHLGGPFGLRRACCPDRQDSTKNQGLAGAGGFEPPNDGTKNRCLTAWRRPKRVLPSAPPRRPQAISRSSAPGPPPAKAIPWSREAVTLA